jgi:predicted ABC-type sugar transport system permease subunit
MTFKQWAAATWLVTFCVAVVSILISILMRMLINDEAFRYAVAAMLAVASLAGITLWSIHALEKRPS